MECTSNSLKKREEEFTRKKDNRKRQKEIVIIIQAVSHLFEVGWLKNPTTPTPLCKSPKHIDRDIASIMIYSFICTLQFYKFYYLPFQRSDIFTISSHFQNIFIHFRAWLWKWKKLHRITKPLGGKASGISNKKWSGYMLATMSKHSLHHQLLSALKLTCTSELFESQPL